MWIKARYQGVRYRESIARTIRVKGHTRPDRCFYIYYKIGGKAINEKVGWESEGVNASQARDVRGEILVNIRTARNGSRSRAKRAGPCKRSDRALEKCVFLFVPPSQNKRRSRRWNAHMCSTYFAILVSNKGTSLF